MNNLRTCGAATFHSSVVFVDPKKKSNYSALNLLASALMILTSLATMSRSLSLVTNPLYMYISTPVLTVMNIWFVKIVMSWELVPETTFYFRIKNGYTIRKLYLMTIFCPNPNATSTQPNLKLGSY